MPTITKFQELYEVLLRFEGGALKGAHAQYVSGVREDGATIQAKPGPAIPLSLVDAADKPTLAAALGEATSALVAAKEAAEAEAAEVRAESKAKDATAQDLRARIAELEAEARVAAASDAGKLRADLAAKDANIQTLLAEVEALRAGAQG